MGEGHYRLRRLKHVKWSVKGLRFGEIERGTPGDVGDGRDGAARAVMEK